MWCCCSSSSTSDDARLLEVPPHPPSVKKGKNNKRRWAPGNKPTLAKDVESCSSSDAWLERATESRRSGLPHSGEKEEGANTFFGRRPPPHPPITIGIGSPSVTRMCTNYTRERRNTRQKLRRRNSRAVGERGGRDEEEIFRREAKLVGGGHS